MHWKLTILDKVKQIHMFSLTSRSAKTWDLLPFRCGPFWSVFLQGTFCGQPEVSTTFGDKVMTHYVFIYIFTKVVTLTLPFIRLSKKKFCIVACPEDIFCKKNQDDRTSSAACRAFEDRQTNKHADRQTRRQTVVTNILCENRRFRKVIKDNRGF